MSKQSEWGSFVLLMRVRSTRKQTVVSELGVISDFTPSIFLDLQTYFQAEQIRSISVENRVLLMNTNGMEFNHVGARVSQCPYSWPLNMKSLGTKEIFFSQPIGSVSISSVRNSQNSRKISMTINLEQTNHRCTIHLGRKIKLFSIDVDFRLPLKNCEESSPSYEKVPWSFQKTIWRFFQTSMRKYMASTFCRLSKM